MSVQSLSKQVAVQSGETILTNASMVLRDEVVRGSLRIERGLIVDIDLAPSRSPAALDLDGAFLMPGLVDVHTDNLERHFQPRSGVLWDGVAAAIAHDGQVAASGITTVFDSLTVGAIHGWDVRADMIQPMIDGLEAARAADMLRIDHLLHLRCECTHPELMGIVEQHASSHLTRLFSLMDHAPGSRQSPDVATYKRRMVDGGKSPAEVDAHVDALIEASLTYGPKNRELVAAFARHHSISLATHDDSLPEHVAEAIRLGATLTEFPTTLEAAQAAKKMGLPTLMGSPNLVRGHSHSGNVAAQTLADDSLLDMLASDYIPASLLMGAAVLIRGETPISLPDAIATVSDVPALAVGLTDRGRIEVGLRADLIQVQFVHDRPIVRGVWSAGRRTA